MLTSALMFGHQNLILGLRADFKNTYKHSKHSYSYSCGAAALLLTKSAGIRDDKMVGLREGLAAEYVLISAKT